MTPAHGRPDAMPGSPTVSVIVPNYNGGAFLADSIMSACRQSLRDIEIIVVDDASSDNSVEIIAGLMRRDRRIRLLASDRNRGPGAARNRALRVATGEWIAVLDSDDVMHPERLSSLVVAGEKDLADIVADDLLIFDGHHIESPQTLLRGRWAQAPFWLDTETYVRRNNFFGRGPALGYLKPLFRASFLKSADAAYDERLRVAEDFDFAFRLLQHGARFRVYPLLLYFYRKHGGSISHRLTTETIQAIKSADREARARCDKSDRKLMAALEARTRSIDRTFAFYRLVDAIKRRDLVNVGRVAMTSPRALMLLRLPIAARLKWRRRAMLKKDCKGRRQVCVLARQRVVGATNGSSIYLLGLVAALAHRGVDVHFLSPSPATLGRWPYLALGKEMAVFRTIRVRGTWRIGRCLVATNPKTLLRGLMAVVEKVMLRIGLISRPVFKSAPYAIACPLTREDQLFIAQHVATVGDALIADYCFLTDAFPYALRPDAKTAVIMHDLFSSRARQFTALGSADSVVSLSEDEECALLAKADAVVAIQKDEAEFLRKRIPQSRIIVAPMATSPVAAPQPGRGDRMFFVGSSAAPNVDGLHWFLEKCWPQIRGRRPAMALRVAGTVCDKIGVVPAGVELLGVVGDLAPFYAEAGLVFSPLRAGSGLKVKLIEALGRGKAVVATSVTLQGVAGILQDCVRVADDPEHFVSAILDLNVDEDARSALAARGLAAIARYFSPEACYNEFVDAMT
jgi:succinoglycan biosynthesis protein ExoO